MSSQFVLMMDRQGVATYASPNLRRLGFGPGYVLGSSDALFPLADAQSFRENMERALESGEPVDYPSEYAGGHTWLYPTPDGLLCVFTVAPDSPAAAIFL